MFSEEFETAFDDGDSTSYELLGMLAWLLPPTVVQPVLQSPSDVVCDSARTFILLALISVNYSVTLSPSKDGTVTCGVETRGAESWRFLKVKHWRTGRSLVVCIPMVSTDLTGIASMSHSHLDIINGLSVYPKGVPFLRCSSTALLQFPFAVQVLCPNFCSFTADISEYF